MQYVIDSPDLCKCGDCQIYKIRNQNQPDDFLIVKVYPHQNNYYYQKESHILGIIQNIHNNDNILRLRHVNINFHVDFGQNPAYLYFTYFEHKSFYYYLYYGELHDQFDEDEVKYIGYRLLLSIGILHQNNIVHNKLTLTNIMLNQLFDPIIIHFKDASHGANENLNYKNDFKDLANILIQLMTNGKYCKIEKGKKNKANKYMVTDQMGGEKDIDILCKINIINSKTLPQEFANFVKLLVETTNLNINHLLNHPWLNGINNNPTIQGTTRQLFRDIYEKSIINMDQTRTENINHQNYINEEENAGDDSLFPSGNRGGETEKDLLTKFLELNIQVTNFKPMGNSLEYLIIEISNYNHDRFLNKFIYHLYLNIDQIEDLENFCVNKVMPNPNKNSYLSFDVSINKSNMKDDSDEKQQNDKDNIASDDNNDDNDNNEDDDDELTINLELVEYREDINENIIHNYINRDVFYLLFNYQKGELSYYYHFVKIFKEKAKQLLKDFPK